VSPSRRGGRFSYLASADELAQTKLPQEEESQQESNAPSVVSRQAPPDNAEGTSDGEGGRDRAQRGAKESPTDGAQELASVPKGQGRMKQERSQLNVRIPTPLKRRASAKAVLEGRDIGEVVEELLREYLER
jgi:hypothetical protein